ncbi:hypothetical protein [Listeria fleischmannii]|uniref:Uncharacterized protein n=1 Tax=Listeria fleischmannii FSL S10-1203 TaxID=1265822 RepID=W7DN98_9LIST|nr:hypothetical protein [Listeria fleischmannii]EUJ56428.1 hypothetical protein MCOL2_08936 [Listeria fleischmannii FSL S10-1203]
MKVEFEGVTYDIDKIDTYNRYTQDRLKYIMYSAYRNIRDSVLLNRCQGKKLNEVRVLAVQHMDRALRYTKLTESEIDSVFSFMEKYFPKI